MPESHGGGFYGPTAVGLLALKDKKFFAALLAAPEEALRLAMDAGRLQELSSDELKTVVELVDERNRLRPDADAMELWERYHRTAVWDLQDWPRSWPEYGLPGRRSP